MALSVDDFSNIRIHPITGVEYPDATKPQELYTIAEFPEFPGLYGFQLQDRPDEGTVTMTQDTDGTVYTLVTTDPSVGQIRIHYQTGYCFANPADAGNLAYVDYDRLGTNLSLPAIQAMVDASFASYDPGVSVHYGHNLLSLISNGTALPKVVPGSIEVNGVDVDFTEIHQTTAAEVIEDSWQTLDDYRHYWVSVADDGVTHKHSLAYGQFQETRTVSSVVVTAGVAEINHAAGAGGFTAADVIIVENTDFGGVFEILSSPAPVGSKCYVNTSAADGTYSGGGDCYVYYPFSTLHNGDGVTYTHSRFTDSTVERYSPSPIPRTDYTGYYLNVHGRGIATATGYRIYGFFTTGASGTVQLVHSYGFNLDKKDNILLLGNGANLAGSALYTRTDLSATVTMYNYKYSTVHKLWGDDYIYVVTATDAYLSLLTDMNYDINATLAASASGTTFGSVALNTNIYNYVPISANAGSTGYSYYPNLSKSGRGFGGDTLRIVKSDNYAPAASNYEFLSVVLT